MKTVSLVKFLWLLLRCGSLVGVSRALCSKCKNKNITSSGIFHDCSGENFRITFWGFTCFCFLQTNKAVENALNTPGDCQTLSFINRNFFNACGRPFGIGNLDIAPRPFLSKATSSYTRNFFAPKLEKIPEDLWYHVHDDFRHTINLCSGENANVWAKLVENHLDLLTCSHSKLDSFQDKLSRFLSTVWCKFCIGQTGCDSISLVSPCEFLQIQKSITRYVDAVYHSNRIFNLCPGLGSLICHLKHVYHRNQSKHIDAQLYKFVQIAQPTSFIGVFAKRIQEHDWHPLLKTKILLDNVFLIFLAYDFLYIYLHELVMQKIRKPKTWPISMDSVLKRAFFYPFRFRWISEIHDETLSEPQPRDNETTHRLKSAKEKPKQGCTLVVLNLVSSNHFFSSGLRTCPGAKLTSRLSSILENALQAFHVQENTVSHIDYGTNCNLPIPLSTHYVNFEFDRRYLKEYIASSYSSLEQTGMSHINQIETILHNVSLWRCVWRRIEMEICVLQQRQGINGIVIARPQNIVFAGLGATCCLPLYIVREKGHIEGHTNRPSYHAIDGEEQVLEISSQQLAFENKNGCEKKRRLVLVNDGIYTGASLRAAIHLLESLGGEVAGVICIINYAMGENNKDRVWIDDYLRHRQFIQPFNKDDSSNPVISCVWTLFDL